MNHPVRIVPEGVRNASDIYELALAEVLNERAHAVDYAEEIPLLDEAAALVLAMRDRTLLNAVAMGTTQTHIAEHLGVSQQAVGQQLRVARRREQERATERKRKRTGGGS
jgi:FixJ family two-component response regulator